MSARGGNGRDGEDAGAPGPNPEDAAAQPEADETGGEPAASAGEDEGQATAGPAGLAEAAGPSTDVEALRRERDELADSLLRRRAEFQNYKKRVERERAAAEAEAAAAVLRRVLDTVDNLERALGTAEGDEALHHGVELTLRELRLMLESQGVAVVEPLGEPFDPRLHQALVHEHVPGYAEGTVAEVFRKGYTFKDRLLRPALVKVASGATDRDPADERGGPEVQ